MRSTIERHQVSPRERALAQRLAYGAVQRRGTSDEFIERLSGRRLRKLDAPILAALRLGIYELLYTDSADHAAVDQAVSLAHGSRGGRRAAGLVNAVLRRVAREREALLGSLSDEDPAGAAIKHSHPLWLAELWWQERGAEQARALLAAANEPPERTFRFAKVESGRSGAGNRALADELAAEGLEFVPAETTMPPLPDELLILVAGGWEVAERAVAEGRLLPQSRASAAVVAGLDPQPGQRILDLCSGPGIKTTQLAAAVGSGGEVVAVEVNPARAREVTGLCERVGSANVRVLVADAADFESDDRYDRVLIDPPCSGLGTLASRPDARWRRSPEQITEMAALQKRILARGAAALKAGGTLVYSTCTLSRAENEEVVGIAGELGLAADPIPGARPDTSPALETDPARDGTDGFFIARFASRL